MNFHKKQLSSEALMAPVWKYISQSLPVVKRIIKSPGTGFMVASALLNASTQPWMMATYAAGLVAQCVAQTLCANGETSNKLLKFLGGEQGGLATNAAITLAAGIIILAMGTASPALGCALTAFGLANGGQASIRGNILKLEGRKKDFALTACDAAMGIGFFCLGNHVKMPTIPLTIATIANASMIACRAIWGNKIPADLMYADMMMNAGTTFLYAGNLHQYDIAASRAFALLAISRIATERAQDKGKKSYLDIFRLPEAVRYASHAANSATQKLIKRAMQKAAL